ncbi:MAG: iron-sulfur cluster-binding protein [Rhodospirillales bacterium]|nr:iron-sulfur cluster-binding protein [Rhodospirillales bacterium]
MDSSARRFENNARAALATPTLQAALAKLADGFPSRRREAAGRLPEFDELRDAARAIKDHVLDHLDVYLETFERRVVENGGEVHWCRDAEEARQTILEICRRAGARTVTKSKTMIGEEIAINDHLERNGIRPVETDLGEYIIQLRREPPSHIIAPAIHLSLDQVAETFRRSHADLPRERTLNEPDALLAEARAKLRPDFLAADVGITGANMLIAETGGNVLVTNEGNADLTHTLPRVHVVIASIEKIVPTLEDATVILRVLARSATGQDITVYTSFCSGPRRPGDLDGPDEYHVILLDNGRARLLEGEFRDMLRCIRCGACLNHCPVYRAVGGHAYGWVYSGPMGAVLIPALLGTREARHLANASTLCGRCESVCPMRIPLPRMLRAWRELLHRERRGSLLARLALAAWASVASRPALYHRLMGPLIRALGNLAGARRRFRRLPFLRGWTQARDLPAPEGETFMTLWAEAEKNRRELDALGARKAAS